MIKSTFAAIISIAWLFIGYFTLPLVIRGSLGFLGTLAGAVNDRSRGGFDRLKNFRRKQASDRYKDAKEGRGGYVGANALGKVYRRTSMPGGLSPTRRGRAKFAAAELKMRRLNADEALKEDAGFASGNDDANALATQENMSRGRFLREYAQMQIGAAEKNLTKSQTRLQELQASGAPQADIDSAQADVSSAQASLQTLQQGGASRAAQAAMAEMEHSYGAQMGSDAMRITAFKARAASNKGYNLGSAEKNYQAAFTDAGSLVNSKLMTVSDAAAVIKSNGARTDFSGMGFGAAMNQIATSADRIKQGITDPAQVVTKPEVKVIANDVLKGSGPGQIMAGRHEAVEALAPHMLENLAAATTTARQAPTRENLSEADRQLAYVASLYDEMGRNSPIKQEIMGKGVMSQSVQLDGEAIPVHQLIEQARGRETFKQWRREYSNQFDEYRQRGGGQQDGDQTH